MKSNQRKFIVKGRIISSEGNGKFISELEIPMANNPELQTKVRMPVLFPPDSVASSVSIQCGDTVSIEGELAGFSSEDPTNIHPGIRILKFLLLRNPKHEFHPEIF